MAEPLKRRVPVLSRGLLAVALVVGLVWLAGPDAGRLRGQTRPKVADKVVRTPPPVEVSLPAATPTAPTSSSAPPPPQPLPAGGAPGPQQAVRTSPAGPGQPQLPGAGSGGPPPNLPPPPQAGTALDFSGPGSRFHFKIDPKTPVKDLLPTAPRVRKASGPLMSDDLA